MQTHPQSELGFNTNLFYSSLSSIIFCLLRGSSVPNSYRRRGRQVRCETGCLFFFGLQRDLFPFFPSVRAWVKGLAKLLHLGHIDITREIQPQQERVFTMPLRIG